MALRCPDPSSYSNHHQVQTKRFHLVNSPNFESKTFSSTIDLDVEVIDAAATSLSLDVYDLVISSVAQIDKLRGQVIDPAVVYDAKAETGPLGQRLLITLPTNLVVGQQLFFRIVYTTSPQASASQFLSPAQTASGKYPYVYTQCQATHARSLIPIQDSCTCKVTYSAEVTVQAPLVVIMSACLDGEPIRNELNNTITYKYIQNIPIPPYLYALAIGEIATRKVGKRTAVHAEPSDIVVAEREYKNLEHQLEIIEGIAGPYRWGDYSILSMPAGFPFGGMEGQNTFNSGSLLPLPMHNLTIPAAPKPTDEEEAKKPAMGLAVNVALHEAAHSWSGNLTTNLDWQEFFLNEGLTIFIERRSLQKMYGKEYESLHRMIGWEDLLDSVNMYKGMDMMQATKLVTNLEGQIDPDDYFSSVPYEKGFSFFIYLEEILGGQEVFEQFLKVYFNHYALKTLTHKDLKAFYINYAQEHKLDQRLNEIDWDTWFYAEGLPIHKPAVNMKLADEIYQIAEQLTTVDAAPVADLASVLQKWSSTQHNVFLDKIAAIFDAAFEAAGEDVAARQQVQQFYKQKVFVTIFDAYDYISTANSELISRVVQLYIRVAAQLDQQIATYNGQAISMERCLTWFLESVGRMKFVRPTFRFMLKSAIYKPFAVALLPQVQDRYHIICTKMLQRDVESAKDTVY